MKPRHHRALAVVKPTPSGATVMGVNPLLAILDSAPQRIVRVYTSASERSQSRNRELLARLEGLDVPIVERSRDELTALVGSDAHQGWLAEVKERQALSLQDLLATLPESGEGLIVALDGVQDPHNIGAIMRAAECFGARAVLWSHNRGPAVTPAVAKASAGASELLDVVTVSNLAQALERLKDAQFWVVAADNTPQAQELGKFEFPKRCVLVLGGEGDGIRDLTGKRADFVVKIPLRGRTESLNVSQAAAVLMSQWALCS